MNKTVREANAVKPLEAVVFYTAGGALFLISGRFFCSSQDSYEMFVEMDKMDGEMDVTIKKKKKEKKKERLENMKKEMDIVSDGKVSRPLPGQGLQPAGSECI